MKLLTAFLTHSPAFDSCFPLLERIHQRGRVRVRVILGRRLTLIEPRVLTVCKSTGIPFVRHGALRIGALCYPDIMMSSALLTHSDPLAYGKGKPRLRDSLAMRLRKPLIFVQHGMVQAGLHYPGNRQTWKFAAVQMLLWKPLPPDASNFIENLADHQLVVTGLIKTNRLGPSPLANQLREFVAGYRHRVLICHNYGFEDSLYSIQAQSRMLDIWNQVIASRPDTLFILRSHRARRHAAFQRQIHHMRRNNPNLLISERHRGLMRMSTIHDVLPVVERVITHPSTVVLDAIYSERPVAVFDSKIPELNPLYQANEEDSISAFLDDENAILRSSPIRAVYGDIEENLSKAAAAVEELVSSL